MKKRWQWQPPVRQFRDADGLWSIHAVAEPSTSQSRMFEEIRREREEWRRRNVRAVYRGVVTWKYDGPDLGPAFPYANQVSSPNE